MLGLVHHQTLMQLSQKGLGVLYFEELTWLSYSRRSISYSLTLASKTHLFDSCLYKGGHMA